MADSVTTSNIGSNATMASGTRDQTSDGLAIVAAPGAGKRVSIKEIYYWLVNPAHANTVTLKLGSVTLPAVQLSSSRGNFSMYRGSGEEILCGANEAVYLNLSATDAVGFMCFYNVR